jgi:hypothetical protein
MSNELLEKFLVQECTSHIKGMLQTAIERVERSEERFAFNLFEITIQHEAGVVIVEDVLDATSAGAQQVPLDEFALSLARWSARPTGSENEP